MDPRKRITSAEIDQAFDVLLAKYKISRSTNILTYMFYKKYEKDERVVEYLNAPLDIYFDEEVQKFVVPIPSWLEYRSISEYFSRFPFSLDRDASRSSTYDLTRKHTCIYVDREPFLRCYNADLEAGIQSLRKNTLAKFQEASVPLINKTAHQSMTVSFQPFLIESLIMIAGSDLDTVLKSVLMLKHCFDHLPDQNPGEFTSTELQFRMRKFFSEMVRLSPFLDESHPFAAEHPDEFRALTALKMAYDNYVKYSTCQGMIDALSFLEEVNLYLNSHEIHSSHHETVIGRYLLDGLDLTTFAHCYYSYDSHDPVNIRFTVFALTDDEAKLVTNHLQQMDESEEMRLHVINKSNTDDANYFEFKVKSSDALHVILPWFKKKFENTLEQKPKEIEFYRNKQAVSPSPKRISRFFDSPLMQVDQSSKSELRKFVRK